MYAGGLHVVLAVLNTRAHKVHVQQLAQAWKSKTQKKLNFLHHLGSRFVSMH